MPQSPVGRRSRSAGGDGLLSYRDDLLSYRSDDGAGAAASSPPRPFSVTSGSLAAVRSPPPVSPPPVSNLGESKDTKVTLNQPPAPRAKPNPAAAASKSGLLDSVMSMVGDFLRKKSVGFADMIQLPHLEEQDLLHNLNERFSAEIVYTYIGDIVVSVNPFKHTGNDSKAVHDAYVAMDPSQAATSLPPHIFCLVGQAYSKMREQNARSLSILISGESGAGKTEAMKLCVAHLGAIASAKSAATAGIRATKGDTVATKLMKTNPIMEPIGNAKTVRNNNSSRFGKHFDIQFDWQGQIMGAFTSTYLLEKPRIVQHMPGERNYHIFYMLSKANSEVRSAGRILNDWQQYAILNQQGTIERVTSWDDEGEMAAMHAALSELGFSDVQRNNFYCMVAIVMHIGNVRFQKKDFTNPEGGGSTEGAVVSNEPQLELVCALLQVTREQLVAALTKTTLVVGLDEIEQQLSAAKATAALGSLCMHIYSLAFSWCVKKINDSIAVPPEEAARCIGVLDIFGFENFNAKGQINSFPQLCINLTNERLHQIFIEHIFEVEQRFYKSEDIEWSSIDYFDNKVIIELIAKKPGGVLSLVDDECQKRTATNDAALLENLHSKFDKPPTNKIYIKPKVPGSFVIHHFAGEVSYTIDSFIEKNKDELSPTIKALIEQHTRFDELKTLAHAENRRMDVAVQDVQSVASESPDKKGKKGRFGGAGGGGAGGGKRTRKKTVSESFGESLNSLMDMLGQTDHHYIRCLKPNHALRAGVFDDELMLLQLGYSGTLEVTKVRKAGLYVRRPLGEFFSRYKICAHDVGALRASTMREKCLNLLRQSGIDSETWRVGRTLVFMANVEVLKLLDHIREMRLSEYAVRIQGYWKMRKPLKQFKLKQKYARRIQHQLRAVRTRRAYEQIREKTQVLQHAALVKIARMRARELKQHPDRFREVLRREGEGFLDEITSAKTGTTISLTMSVALSFYLERKGLLLKGASPKEVSKVLHGLTPEQRKQLLFERERLAANPEDLINQASHSQLSAMVLANMLWLRSGVQVRLAGRLAKKGDELAKLPQHTTHGWSALVWARLETINPNDDPIEPNEHGRESPVRRLLMRHRVKHATDETPPRRLVASLVRGTLVLEEGCENLEQPHTIQYDAVVGVFPLTCCKVSDRTLSKPAGKNGAKTKGSRNSSRRPIISGIDEGNVIEQVVLEQTRTLVHEHNPEEEERLRALRAAEAKLAWWRWAVGGSETLRGTPVDEHADVGGFVGGAAARHRVVFCSHSVEDETPNAKDGDSPQARRTGSSSLRTTSLAELTQTLRAAIADCCLIDKYIVKPRPVESADADGGQAADNRISQADSKPAGLGGLRPGDVSLPLPSGTNLRRDSTSSDGGIIKEGFLLRRLHRGIWGRRYFVLTDDGQLRWYRTRDQVEGMLVGGESTAPAGQLTLRFFSPELCASGADGEDRRSKILSSAGTHYSDEPAEDHELQLMLPSCAQIEMRSGREVLRLAAQRAVADEWLQALTRQCVLNYPKSPVFSDKHISVRWMDGKVYMCSVGENTTSTDVVRRLCRTRMVTTADGATVPLVENPGDWALFEVQRRVPGGAGGAGAHDVDERSPLRPERSPSRSPSRRHVGDFWGSSSGAMLGSSSGGSSPASPLPNMAPLPKSPSEDVPGASASGARHGARRTELIWRQLPLHEPLLDQLIMRWELTARREFGASPAVPPGAFELVIRKIYSNGSRGSTNVFEAELEMAQVRSDLLDGRLTRALRPDELLDLACVLALREMHVRRSRRPGHSPLFNLVQNTFHSASRGKTPSTIEFDLTAKELTTVLPPDLLMEQFGVQESSAGGGGWNRGGSTRGAVGGVFDQSNGGGGSVDVLGGDGGDGFSLRHEDRMLERLSQRYKILLKRPLDKWDTLLPGGVLSDTAQIVQLIRQEALGVNFDAKGQVVVTQKSAERILRDRLADEPLCFGSLHTAGVWAGYGQPVQPVLVALSHSGVHLHSLESRPRRLGSFLFEWQTASDSRENTIVGWSCVPRVYATEQESERTSGDLHGPYGAASLVLQLLVAPGESDLHTIMKLRAAATARTGGGDSLTTPRGGALLSERSSRAIKLHRRRGKLVLLTREGDEMMARLQQYADQYAQREKVTPGGARSYFTTPAAKWSERSSWASRMMAGADSKVSGNATKRGGFSKQPSNMRPAGNATKLLSDFGAVRGQKAGLVSWIEEPD